MAIGVAETLVKDGEIIEQALCEAFVENYEPYRGYGRGARIILQATEKGLDHKHRAKDLFPGGPFGNGAAMRVAPVGILFHQNECLSKRDDDRSLQDIPDDKSSVRRFGSGRAVGAQQR